MGEGVNMFVLTENYGKTITSPFLPYHEMNHSRLPSLILFYELMLSICLSKFKLF